MFFSIITLKGFFYQNKDERLHLISVKTNLSTTSVLRAAVSPVRSYLFAGYFISISCCYKFIIHPGWVSFTLSSYAPTTQSPWQRGSQSIRPGRGMICELRVKSHAPAWTLSPPLALFTHSQIPRPSAQKHTYRHMESGAGILLSSYCQGHPSWRTVISPSWPQCYASHFLSLLTILPPLPGVTFLFIKTHLLYSVFPYFCIKNASVL